MEHKIAEIIGKTIGNMIVTVFVPALLLMLVWNNTLADTFNAAHFNYGTFIILCLSIRLMHK